MAQENVGFDFEFGLKGSEKVERVLDSLEVRLLNNRNAGEAVASALGRLTKAFGGEGLGLAVGVTALALFVEKSYEAGEVIEKNRRDIERLTQTPVSGFSQEELDQNIEALSSKLAEMGLDAGDDFGRNFWSKVGEGAKSYAWNGIAFMDNSLFGGNTGNYNQVFGGGQNAEDTRQEEQVQALRDQKKKNQFDEDTSKAQNDFLDTQDKLYQNLVGATALPGQNLDGGNFQDGFRAIQYSEGIRPDSYEGRKYTIEQQRTRDDSLSDTALMERNDAKNRLFGLQKSPVPIDSHGQALTEQRQKDIGKLQDEIASYQKKSLEASIDYNKGGLALQKLQQEQVRNQRYGHLRELGLGGHAPGDTDARGRTLVGGKAVKLETQDTQAAAILTDLSKLIAKLGTPTLVN